jgi:hypothetical protein
VADDHDGVPAGARRVYTPLGSTAHLLNDFISLNLFPYAVSFCGRSPRWPYAWLGEGDQAEYDEALRRPLCRACVAKVSFGALPGEQP